MDAVIVLCIALVIMVTKRKVENTNIDKTESIHLKVKLNENFKHDDDAFMELAHELGFRNNDTV